MTYTGLQAMRHYVRQVQKTVYETRNCIVIGCDNCECALHTLYKQWQTYGQSKGALKEMITIKRSCIRFINGAGRKFLSDTNANMTCFVAESAKAMRYA